MSPDPECECECEWPGTHWYDDWLCGGGGCAGCEKLRRYGCCGA